MDFLEEGIKGTSHKHYFLATGSGLYLNILPPPKLFENLGLIRQRLEQLGSGLSVGLAQGFQHQRIELRLGKQQGASSNIDLLGWHNPNPA